MPLKIKMKIKLLLILFVLPVIIFGQQQNNKSRSELGVLIGGSYYLGDLNPTKQFYNTELAYGFMYRYNMHSRLALRFNLLKGSVSASDVDATRAVSINRNLNFGSDIYELAGGLEFNYFPFRIGHDRYRGTAYLLAQVAMFHMNPYTLYNGNEVYLQPLGTEGQGSDLSSKKPYKLNQLSVPLGVGFKLSLGKKASVGGEFGVRKTFTDYLDDVHSDNYVDPVKLAEQNGPLAAELANRTLNGERYGKRGNAATSDWYVFFGATLTFRLGKPNVCFNH